MGRVTGEVPVCARWCGDSDSDVVIATAHLPGGPPCRPGQAFERVRVERAGAAQHQGAGEGVGQRHRQRDAETGQHAQAGERVRHRQHRAAGGAWQGAQRCRQCESCFALCRPIALCRGGSRGPRLPAEDPQRERDHCRKQGPPRRLDGQHPEGTTAGAKQSC